MHTAIHLTVNPKKYGQKLPLIYIILDVFGKRLQETYLGDIVL